MKNNNIFKFSKKKKTKSKLRLYLSALFLLIILCSLGFYELFNYKLLYKDFINLFDENNFSDANIALITRERLNPFKAIFLERDLTKYFNDKISSLSSNITKDGAQNNEVMDIYSEIKRYNFISSESNNLFSELGFTDSYKKALSLYNSQNYLEAYNIFNSIDSSDLNYSLSIKYMQKCKDNIKSNILSECDKLSSTHYYTKALDLIDSVKDILGSDKEVLAKSNSIKEMRSSYVSKQNEESRAASSSVLSNISATNINEIAVESLTSYLIHVDLKNQKTYVYKGKLKNWQLEKTFLCSTGINGEDTPQGVYSIKEKGQWFFSEEYQQGGKYWVQFMGDYLFHSLPYNKDKSQIVDYTLGKPSSHGCIRLPEADSKWIYDNVPKGSKVIIK